ncbi:MAG: ABC transporter permease [Verrucomicrobia bacterium]|nr:MAG: ABC transporter permease [Verrucomicrobiota bacterium]
MSAFFTLWRREIAAYFLSPIAYVMMMFFLVIMGFSFWLLANVLAQGVAGVSIMRELFDSFFFWITTLTLVPVLTMRLFAEEKRSGTIETLMTAPVSDAAVVLAKYFGALSFYMMIWAPTILYVVVLRAFSPLAAPPDLGPIAASYLGTLLIGAFYLAIGLMCSAMTRNQIVAAIVCFALLCVLFFGGFIAFIARVDTVREIANYFCSLAHMRDFVRGVVDTRPVVFYLSGAALMLFLAIKLVEARKWK